MKTINHKIGGTQEGGDEGLKTEFLPSFLNIPSGFQKILKIIEQFSFFK